MPPDPGRRWLVLAIGVTAMITASAATFGLGFLIPELRSEGLTLTEASLLVTAPTAGLVLAVIPWGWAADRWGERRILSLGMTGAGLGLLAAAAAPDPATRWALLATTGVAGASVHAASGRLILGWFGVRERGLAMGIRQTGYPIGLALAALVLPAAAAGGNVALALLIVAAGCLASAGLIALLVRDPARHPSDVATPDGRSPYRSPFLWRLHAASALLIVPQFAVSVFAFDALVSGHGMPPGLAGAVLALAQVGGAAVRLLVGVWSDRAGSRLGPMRILTLASGLAMIVLTIATIAGPLAAAVGAALATMATVSTNALAFTAVAERAGRAWSGRALGIQNTGQNVTALVAPPVLSVLIAATGTGPGGYALAFGIAAVVPFLAAFVIPVADEPASVAVGSTMPG